MLPTEIINKLAAVCLGNLTEEEDRVMWGLNSSGIFSVKLAEQLSSTGELGAQWRG